VGPQSGWVLSHECFAWRTFANRKHLGSFAGLTGTPFDSGETLREQGISKAGSGRVRTTMIELAWGWVRWQPGSALTHWFIDRYVRGGTSRSKRKGIVALARKLLVALWKYVEQDIVPEGALLKA
jgi:transposase